MVSLVASAEAFTRPFYPQILLRVPCFIIDSALQNDALALIKRVGDGVPRAFGHH